MHHTLPNCLSISLFFITIVIGLPCGQYRISGFSSKVFTIAISSCAELLLPAFIALRQATL